MAKIVVAIGGNALGNSPEEQARIVINTAKKIVAMVKEGHHLIIVHGNGPQVGMINDAFDYAHRTTKNVSLMPFAECGAMSQGYIGFHLQNAIENELRMQKCHQKVVSLITQVLVDQKDAAFDNPSKPIGDFYSETDALKLASSYNFQVKPDANRGWRRVIASPKPLDIIEKQIIIDLVNNDHIVICGGGGGIPVVLNKAKRLIGIDAVIDKDLTAAKIAEICDADQLIILTAIKAVAINFNTPQQEWLKTVTVKEIKKHIENHHFLPGSMLPKVQAAIGFLETKPSRTAMIGFLEDALLVLNAKAGTRIIV